MKKHLILFTAIFAILAMAGTAFAINTATLNVTSEPIRQYATCDKAGGFTITFDRTTVLMDGDQITADLDLQSYLCREIDIVISNGGGADLENIVTVENVGWDHLNTPAAGAPVTINDGGTVGNFTSVGGGVYFWIHGVRGTARITIDIIGETPGASLTIGSDQEDTLSISFLDQKTNDDYTTDGIYIDSTPSDSTTNDVYDNMALLANNTLCIDVSDYPDNTVDANMDSKKDKFTFIPSDPQVAHIAAAANFQLFQCKDALCGSIIIGSKTGDQTGTIEDCMAIDNELPQNYCAGTHGANYVIIQNLSGAYEQTDYQIVLDIYVNGTQSNTQGVYWSNENVAVLGMDSVTTPCPDLGYSGTGITGSYEYYNASGSLVATPEAPNSMDCDVDGSKPVRLISPNSTLGLAATNDFLYINMPALNYDVDEVSAGMYVTVNVTLLRAPCGELWDGEICVGTFVDSCTGPAPDVSYTLLYPYFTALDAEETYWDGIVLTNVSDAAGTATLTVYEMDGDVAEIEVSVPANGMYVSLLSNMLDNMTPVTTGGSGVLGDARCYIVACTSFASDGFAMMGNPGSGEAMGYLPRSQYMAHDTDLCD
jgi:hypothetical protein